MEGNVVNNLCSLPATDLNFTSELNRATAYQIKQAIETMKQNGGKNKGRIKACDRELENRRLTKKDKQGKYVSKEHLSILCNTFSSEHRLKAILNKLGEYEDAERQDKWIPVTERLPEDGMEDRYLFRGKRIDNGEWVEGYLSYPFCTEKGNESYYFYAKDSLGFFCRCVVDASTICQCTGLKDKNGKLIWENDVVKINNSKVNTVIAFRDFEIICTIPNEKYYKHRLEYDTEYEVIGNTFDNPELLEVQE